MTQAARKIYPPAGQTVKAGEAPILRLSKAEAVSALVLPLRLAVAESRAPAKALARLAGCNPAAAKNWLQGRAAPNAVHLLTLLARVPEFQGEVRRLAGMEGAGEPGVERALAELVRQYQRRG